MKLLITGVAGFVGSTIARTIVERGLNWKIYGIDNLSRRGSELNVPVLKRLGVHFVHGDIRNPSDLESIPATDWILDAAANPSVLAGADGKTSSRQLMEHNLISTINMLERCKATKAGFILLSTSRVYSIAHLSAIPVEVVNQAYTPITTSHSSDNSTQNNLKPKAYSLKPTLPPIPESFPTTAPISLYGASKLASETLAIEYGYTFDFPVWINRCGVLAGAGQFGRPDQGIFAYWINSHLRKRPLKYIGFDGQGHQVRDCLHPRDIVDLLIKQTTTSQYKHLPPIVNVSGGIESARSLRQLTNWCDERFGTHPVSSDPNPRPFDIPWLVLDNSLAESTWSWTPQTNTEAILTEIATHAQSNPHWLEIV